MILLCEFYAKEKGTKVNQGRVAALVIWLVPSLSIVQQNLKGLQDFKTSHK